MGSVELNLPEDTIAENVLSLTRRLVSRPERVAEAIVDAGLRGRAERYVPRPYWITAALRVLVPGVVRRAVSGGAMTPAAASDD